MVNLRYIVGSENLIGLGYVGHVRNKLSFMDFRRIYEGIEGVEKVSRYYCHRMLR